PEPHRFEEQAPVLLDHRRLRPRVQLARPLRQVVPRLDAEEAVVEYEDVSRAELPDALPERPLAVVVEPVREIRRPRRLVGTRRHAGGEERLDLAREKERPVQTLVVIERLDPEPVARRDEAPLPDVP